MGSTRDRTADQYQAEHGDFLRDVGFVWSPEGLDEADARLLGDVAGKRVLEVGCGAGQCGRWLVTQGARPVGFDLSLRQLHHSHRIDRDSGVRLPVVCATATDVPFADSSVDVAFSAYGALPFVRDADRVLREISRVLRARWSLRVLDLPPLAVDTARRPVPARTDRGQLLLRPLAVRRAG